MAIGLFFSVTSCRPSFSGRGEEGSTVVDASGGETADTRECSAPLSEDAVLSPYIAPPGVFGNERTIVGEEAPASVGRGETWGPPMRIDAEAREHLSFRLDFDDERAAVDLELLWWDGRQPRHLGVTNWGRGFRGRGFRVLSAFDPLQPRTFWARARAREQLAGATISVTRWSIEAGPTCDDDCDRLFQVPLPIDPTVQGFTLSTESVYAYHFGRRDLIMALLHAGRRVASAGQLPFEIKRLSRWDGGRPPSHRSHAGGVDVDLSLYNALGVPVWQALCAHTDRRCLGGTWNFGGLQMARLIAAFFDSGLFEARGPAGVLIDRAYHREIRAGADRLLEERQISATSHELFARDQGLLRHVEPHHHHVHIRVGPSPVDDATP